MNTHKQVLVMVVLLMVGLLGIAVYSAWDRGIGHGREASAAEDLTDKTTGRAAILFARNCRLCHGDVGEGGALGGRLAAAPALDRADLQGFIDSKAKLAANITAADTTIPTTDGSKFKRGATILIDIERMEIKGLSGNNLTVARGVGNTTADAHSKDTPIQLLDAAALADKVKLITNTITCGRVGTPMPAWAQSQDGPLSDEQVRQLTTLITGSLLDPISRQPIGPTANHWDQVKEEVDAEDITKAKILGDGIDESTISLPVSDVTFFNEKDAIRIGDERLIVTAVPKIAPTDKDKSGILQVQRGQLNSTPLPHTPDEIIYKFPQAPVPAINQASCGQTAKAPVPTAPPGPKDCAAPCQDVNLAASGVKYSTNTITVKTGQNVRIIFANNDAGVDHNFAVYKSTTDVTAVATGSVGTVFAGVNTDNIVFAAPAPGTYLFRCDVHPTIMFGDFIVQ